MHSRQLSVFPGLAALILYLVVSPLPAGSSTFQANNSSQDQNKAADAGNSAPNDQAKAPVSNIKSAPTDEGQLATVNNAKIPLYAKVYVAPIPGGFENYIIAGLRNRRCR